MSYTVKDILGFEVAPALGCTEPAAIALGAAAAASLLPDRTIDSIEVTVDPKIYKNGIGALIPGAGGLFGLDTASALGAVGGDMNLKLEVLDPIDDASVAEAQTILRDGKVNVEVLFDQKDLYIKTAIKSGRNVAQSVIRDTHDNLVSLTLDGQETVRSSPIWSGGQTGTSQLLDMETWLKSLSLKELLEFTNELDSEDVAFLEEGVHINMRLAEHGLKHGPGLGVGRALERLVRQQLIQRDMILAARMITSAAADARMAGVKLPAMSSAGSGNHGLTAVLPIWAVLDFLNCERASALEAVGFSHIVTAYIKAHTGRLSAVCGCSIAAGAGAAAGITYLLGGDIRHIAGAITNLTEDLAGVICDGAKAGCALKLATAAGTAVQASLFSLQGVVVSPSDGIIGTSWEQTAQNIGALSTQGMIETDRTILKIMLEKRFTGY